MQRENKWQDRLNNVVLKALHNTRSKETDIPYGVLSSIKLFIQSEIDTVIAEERERIVAMIENYENRFRNPAVLSEDEKFYKQKTKEEIINLITKEQ